VKPVSLLSVFNDSKSWAYYYDIPKFVSQNWLHQLDSLPWEEVTSSGGNVTRHSLWITPEDCVCPYKYGRQKDAAWQPIMTPIWLTVMSRDLENHLGLESGVLNSVNCNKYSNPKHDLYWHSDDEELFKATAFDKDTLIVSLSFGATRTFALRKKMSAGQDDVEVNLKHGDILVMGGRTQCNFNHTLKPMTSAQMTAGTSSTVSTIRYNLTFRCLRKHTKECKPN
jgi:alkylated DNA repair dioxygenase AlkB